MLGQADIVSVHVPYFPGKNDNLIDAKFVEQMKPGAVLVNTARGELADIPAILQGLDTGKLTGYGADVILDEGEILGKHFNQVSDVPNDQVQQLLARYPQVLITPHMGSYTEPALQDMISVSYQNFHDYLTTGKTSNAISI